MSGSQPDTRGLLVNSSPGYGTGRRQSDTLKIPDKITPSFVNTPYIGERRPCNDLSRVEKAFLLLYAFPLLGTLVNAIWRLATLPPKSPDFAFALLLIPNAVFSGVFAVLGIFKYRALEILITSVSSFLVLIYIIVDFCFSEHTDMKIARLIIAVLVGPVCILCEGYLVWKYRPNGVCFRHFLFKVVGIAREEPQNEGARWYTFCDLFALNLQLSWNIAILGITSRHNVDTQEIVGLSVWFCLTILFLSVGICANKKKNAKWLKCYCALSVLFGVGYVLYRFVRVGKTDEDPKYRDLQISTYVCGVLIIIVLLWIAVLTFRTGRYQRAASDKNMRTGVTASEQEFAE